MAHVDTPSSLAPLRDFVVATTAVLERKPSEARALDEVGALLSRLVARDDWLPDALAEPDPERYRQYLLHADPLQRFSVVSFVWGPGQSTPIHDHTVWGLIGMLRGEERAEAYEAAADGSLQRKGEAIVLKPGEIDAVSPHLGDIHRVSNVYADRVSISIHVYGANIGQVQRSVYTEAGVRKPFVSGYANTWLPNVWLAG